MKRQFLPSALTLLAILASCSSPTPQAEKSSAPAFTCAQLNGKAYAITIYTGGKVDGNEIFTFHEKTAESDECLKYGFAASEYTCSPAADGSLQFATTMTSEQEGRMDWKGTAGPDRISGSFVWSKAGQADIHYTFEGSLRK
ncbi:MAG: hypothetical protein L6Q97_13680 [Thermoanaerobaculia bacterium]|nr:hypothetical protein [Thermoanaerobaculia bacterium]